MNPLTRKQFGDQNIFIIGRSSKVPANDLRKFQAPDKEVMMKSL